MISAGLEGERLHGRIEELDLELSLGDGPGPSDQLGRSPLGNGVAALGIHVESVSAAGRLSIDAHAESSQLPADRRAHDEMDIPCVNRRTIRPLAFPSTTACRVIVQSPASPQRFSPTRAGAA